MLDKINERLEKEIEKILGKEELSINEIEFLETTRARLELAKIQEEEKIESERRSKELMESMVKTISKM